jgi:hypothetical protein
MVWSRFGSHFGHPKHSKALLTIIIHDRRHLCGQVEPFAQFVIKVLLKSNLVGGLHFKGLLGEP